MFYLGYHFLPMKYCIIFYTDTESIAMYVGVACNGLDNKMLRKWSVYGNRMLCTYA